MDNDTKRWTLPRYILALLHGLALVGWISQCRKVKISSDDSLATTSESNHSLTAWDFPSPFQAIPRMEWPRLDNITCVEEDQPTFPNNWQMRAPHVILMGTMKGGTTALSTYLYQHPLVLRPSHVKEMHFFDNIFDNHVASIHGIHRNTARRFYRHLFRERLSPRDFVSMVHNSTLVAMDDSPRYQFWSDRVPARILCVAPWAKILAVLRNPVDRAYSHYTMLSAKEATRRNTTANAILTFEEWVEMDVQVLKESGVIQDWTKVDFHQFSGSQEERNAWKAYTRTGTHAPIGRGLYAIQLRQWFQTYEAYGRNRSDFLIIRSELMKSDTHRVYQEVLNFLNLPQVPLHNDEMVYSGKYYHPLENETRARLEEFYAPYNQQLYDLLGQDWIGAWDSPKSLASDTYI